MPYIKSHSNYTLQKFHKSTNDGTIFERDITTIGGIGYFPSSQIPIYRSGNFVITVRDDNGVVNEYSKKKWVENEKSGDTWTMTSLEGMISESEDQDDLKIVLKQDYYDFRDFCYYGSLSELLRTSITDVIDRFPGELYGTDKNVYYTTSQTIDGERIDTSHILGEEDYGDSLKYIVNPFGIDIYAKKTPSDANPLKYFADGGYENYEIISGETHIEIKSWEVEYKKPKARKDCFSKGEEMAVVTLKVLDGCEVDGNFNVSTGNYHYSIEENYKDLPIHVFLGDNNTVYYLSSVLIGCHIRPINGYLDIFYNGCDNFQKLLLNPKTTPLYKATFSVIKENDYGYYREFEDFVFPTSEGGYNIDATSFGFNTYTKRLSEIGEFYDDRFTDNLYRSMTHESIKNFDWTKSRLSDNEDEEDFIMGAEKIQKALRIFAREFDETLSYINNINTLYRVTYDERSNIPNYFLTDTLENDGWNVILITPYLLNEYYIDSNGIKKELPINKYNEIQNASNCIGQIYNNYNDGQSTFGITRDFVQDATREIKPYSKNNINDGTENGYFLICSCEIDCDKYTISADIDKKGNKYVISEKGANASFCTEYKNGVNICGYGDNKYTFVKAIDDSGNTQYSRYDECNNITRNRIKSFSDEKNYTFYDINMEFLRRLKINSRYILRHKGTQSGIDMILGMFGLKNKKFNESLNSCKEGDYDYEITEYVAKVTEPICDNWDAAHDMYHIDWINSTKTITYDYRSLSNYNRDGKDITYIPYQGLTASYVINGSFEMNSITYVIDNRTNYITQEGVNKYKISGSTFKIEDTLYIIKDEYVQPFNSSNKYYITWNERYLYPSFNSWEQYDGNPYFQMNGGWRGTKVVGSANTYNFQFDVDNNVVFDKEKPLFKETVRNIRRFETLQEMLSVPSYEISDGQVVYVEKITNDTVVIDGMVYDIKSDSHGRYVEFIKSNGILTVGDDLFFNDFVKVYGYNLAETTIFLEEIPNGHVVKSYFDSNNKLMCSNDTYSITSQQIFDEANSVGFTNYFSIGDFSYSNRIYLEQDGEVIYDGWKRLKFSDDKYKAVNTIINDNKGNNPHNGMIRYDNGEEYFKYFEQLFKYSLENDMFDARCYDNYELSKEDDISKKGFIFDQIEGEDYYHEDYGETKIQKIWWIKGENDEDSSRINVKEKEDELKTINTKVVKITFKLHNKEPFSKEGQSEIKYLDTIVMNYLTQMIPSTSILQIQYK